MYCCCPNNVSLRANLILPTGSLSLYKQVSMFPIALMCVGVFVCVCVGGVAVFGDL